MHRVLSLGIAVLSASLIAACTSPAPTATPVPPTATTVRATTVPATATTPATTVPATATAAPTTVPATATSAPATATSVPPTPAAAAVTTMAIALKEQNASGQTGYAVLTAKGAQTEVVLRATAAISRANHIHTGTCATLGGVVHPLTNMENGSSVTTVNASLASLLTGGFAVNLHNATTASTYTSCGDLPAQTKVLVVPLKEQNASGQTGTATLVSNADKTDVVLIATAGISRANHIHSGTCATLGGVVNPLTNMADGSSVTTLNVTLDSLRTGAFAINLHNATTASVYTACGDIPKLAA